MLARVLLFGAGGRIGSAIATELMSRGHHITGVTRRGTLGGVHGPRLVTVAGDVTDPRMVMSLVPGHDVIASAVGAARGTGEASPFAAAAGALIAGARVAGVHRLVVLGGAGSLEVAPGVQLVDTPDFPGALRDNAHAQRDALALYRMAEDLEWTYISPPLELTTGERTGHYRVGADQLLVDGEGASRISIADFAMAFVDEVEQERAARRRITVAY